MVRFQGEVSGGLGVASLAGDRKACTPRARHLLIYHNLPTKGPIKYLSLRDKEEIAEAVRVWGGGGWGSKTRSLVGENQYRRSDGGAMQT